MHDSLKLPFNIGSLQLPHRLIQGPLAGFSCAPFRTLYASFENPAYCVSEMISAQDILTKHQPNSRYLYRAQEEKIVCYQLAGREPVVLAKAALKLQDLGANLIDLNCGCPKPKIRKKGAGSALLEDLEHLIVLIDAIKRVIQIPLTVKIRIQGDESDLLIAQAIARAGADALIVHGRTWRDDYDKPCNHTQIASIKQAVTIPVIANGDIENRQSLLKIMENTGCDAYMISRAGTGQPWLYRELLQTSLVQVTYDMRVQNFMTHLEGLACLENEYQAVLQSKTLVRYYFKTLFLPDQFKRFYMLNSIQAIKAFLHEGYLQDDL